MSVLKAPAVVALYVSTHGVSSGFPHLLEPFSEDAVVHFTKKHIRVLQLFFHLTMEKPLECFASTLADMPRQL